MSFKDLIPKSAVFSWFCAIAIVILAYRSTVLSCGDMGCRGRFEFIMIGFLLYASQLVILTPLAIIGVRSNYKKTNRHLLDWDNAMIAMVVAILPIIISTGVIGFMWIRQT